MIVCAISLIVMLLSLAAYTGFTFSTAAAQYLNWWVIFLSQYTVSLCLILVFERPDPNVSSDSGSSEKQKKKESSGSTELEATTSTTLTINK